MYDHRSFRAWFDNCAVLVLASVVIDPLDLAAGVRTFVVLWSGRHLDALVFLVFSKVCLPTASAGFTDPRGSVMMRS